MDAIRDRDQDWGPLLPLVFAFDQAPPPEDQSKDHFDESLKQLSVVKAVRSGDAGVWRDEEVEALEVALREIASGEQRLLRIGVHADYGCVVLGREHVGLASEPQLAMELIALDQHRFRVHSHGREFTAVDGLPAECTIDPIPLHLREHLEKFVENELKEAAKVEKHNRSAVAQTGKRGHQRSPPFIHSIYVDGVREVIRAATMGELEDDTAEKAWAITQPKGGMTDVGLHTGGSRRPTSWPLAKAVLRFALRHPPESCTLSSQEFDADFVYMLAMTQLELWLLERQLKAMEGAQQTSNLEIDLLAQMLKSAVLGVDRFSKHPALQGDVLADLARRCESARDKLERYQDVSLAQIADQFRLAPETQRQTDCRMSYRHPRLASPPSPKIPENPSGSMQGDLRLRAAAALGGVPALDIEDMPLDELLSYLRATNKVKKHADSPVWNHFALVTIERYFADLAKKHLNESQDEDTGGVSEFEAYAQHIGELLEQYTQIGKRIQKSWPSMSGILLVEKQSRETLLVWIAYCCVYQVTHQAYPDLQLRQRFSPPLDSSDLRHLVLSDRHLVEALKIVAVYLNSFKGIRVQLFSLRASKEDDVHKLADAFVRSDYRIPSSSPMGSQERIAKVAKREYEEQNRKRAEHWAQVQQRKAKAEKLKTELGTVTEQLAQARVEYHWAYGRDKRLALNNVNELQTQETILENNIRDTLLPLPLLLPLPRDKAYIGRILFFLRMPLLFRLLGNLGFQAQRSLVRQDRQDERKLEGDRYIDYHHRQGGWRSWHPASSAYVDFFMPSKAPTRPGPDSLNSYCREDDGLYYPPERVQMYWFDGRQYSNPFACPTDGRLVKEWTAKLDDDSLIAKAMPVPLMNSSSWQWAVELFDGSDHARGNLPVARPDLRPGWLHTKEQFLHFALLRAFPHEQLRRLCRILHEDALPLDRPEVRVLLTQTLFHVGKLGEDDGKVSLTWKRDLFDGEARRLLCDALAFQVDNLANAPSRYASVPTVSDIGAYLAGYDDETVSCAPVMRKLAKAVQGMADEEQSKMTAALDEGNVEEADLQEMRAKIAVLLAYALRCYRFNSLTYDDVAAICQLSVRLRHIHSSIEAAETPSAVQHAASALRHAASEVIAPRLTTVIDIVDSDTKSLSQALRSVIKHAPSSLEWEPLEAADAGVQISSAEVETCCWEAEHEGNLYNINLLTGEVLINSAPLGRLPQSVVSDPLYIRTFGADRNFEVGRLENGVTFRTTRAIAGAFYQFTPAEDSFSGKLIVTELPAAKVDQPECWLHLIADSNQWALELPPMIREPHSFWSSNSTVYVRGASFLDRKIYYVLAQHGHSSGEGTSRAAAEEGHVDVLKGDAQGGMCRDQQSPNSGELLSWTCWRVPEHLQEELWSAPTRSNSQCSFDQLMVSATRSSDSTIAILAKFESRDYIHVYQTSSLSGCTSFLGSIYASDSMRKVSYTQPTFEATCSPRNNSFAIRFRISSNTWFWSERSWIARTTQALRWRLEVMDYACWCRMESSSARQIVIRFMSPCWTVE